MDELAQTFLEEYQGALEELEKERYKNAVILSSKALFALCDILIQQKLNKLPKNHTERFRILQDYFPDTYTIVDKIFTHYTDAYSKPILKETCEEITHGIKTITTTHELPDAIKKIAQ